MEISEIKLINIYFAHYLKQKTGKSLTVIPVKCIQIANYIAVNLHPQNPFANENFSCLN